jgi:hypothetical protein
MEIRDMKRNIIVLVMVWALSLFGMKVNAQKVDSNTGLVVWTGMTLSEAVQASQTGFARFYITVNNQGKLVTTSSSSEATQWIVVSEQDFNNAMTQVTWGEVDLGVFVQGGEFSRDNKDLESWVWGSVFSNQGESTPLDNQADSRNLNSSPRHWHQRNQNVMCNGVLIANGIRGNLVGTNINGVGANTNYDKEAFQNQFADYYAGEIYNYYCPLNIESSDKN